MDVLVADGPSSSTGEILEGAVVVLPRVADAPAGAAFDPSELLDVDVDELARPRALVADGLLEPEPAELAHADPGQDPGDRRECHPERLSDLGGSKTQPPQLRDRLDPIHGGAVGDMLRRRRAIVKPC